MYPLEQTYNTRFFEKVLGWMYPGSADPILFNNHTNCVPADHTSHTATALEISCVCLGLPYLFLEFFLPVSHSFPPLEANPTLVPALTPVHGPPRLCFYGPSCPTFDQGSGSSGRWECISSRR